MPNNVFANGREISCKKADGKSICCFPDVCFTPPDKVPPTPPGVPIPYPNTGMAKDTTGGSKKVKISGQEVLLKNKSHFKKTVGNEAGCATKKGLVTSKTTGKAYFNAWSMDVKVEGKNVVRHLDLTTHNHGSTPPNTAPWPYTDSMAFAKYKACASERKAVDDNCKKDKNGRIACPDRSKVDKAKRMAKGPAKDKAMRKAYRAYSKKIEKNKCNKAARCALTPYEPSRCCPPQTPHHLVPKSQFYKKSVDDGKKLPGCKKYNANKAPCICVEGTNHSMASHGLLHFDQKAAVEKRFFKNKKPEFTGKERWSCTEAEQQGADAVEKIFPQCSAACIKAQLRAAHREQGIKADTKIKPTNPGPKERPDFDPAPNGLSR